MHKTDEKELGNPVVTQGRINLKRVIVVLFSILLAGSLYAGNTLESMRISNEGAEFSYQNASFHFDVAGSIVIRAGNRFLSITKLGNNREGKIILKTADQTLKARYENDGNGPVFDNEEMANDFIADFYASLSPGNLRNISMLHLLMRSFANGSDLQGVKYPTLNVTNCTAYKIAAIGAFVACPVIFALGCLAAAYFIYEEWQNCKSGK